MMLRMILVALFVTALCISCTEGAGAPFCIFPRTCERLKFGQYPDCRFCNTYITCSNGYDYTTTCNLWESSIYNFIDGVCVNDIKGECNRRKVFIPGATTEPMPTPIPLVCPHGREQCCVENCMNLPDGLYGSCLSCNSYVQCANKRATQMPCSPTTVWDDEKKTCDFNSNTCKGPRPTVTPSCNVTMECRSQFGNATNDECLRVKKGTKVIGVKPIQFGGPGAPFLPVPCIESISFGITTRVPSDNAAEYTYLYTRLGCCATFTLDVCPENAPN